MPLEAQDNPFPSILIREGTEPSAPSAGDQRLYVDSTTHVLMITNSAGIQSAIGGVTGGVTAGTSFPGSPATNDLYHRTDLGFIFYYDGTRWLSLQMFIQQLVVRGNGGGTTVETGDISSTIAASTSATRTILPSVFGAAGIWIVNHKISFSVFAGGTALGASHKWVGLLIGYDATPTTTGTVATVNIDSGSSGVFRETTVTVGAALAANTIFFQTTWTKTGTPGALAVGEQFAYRLIAT